MNEVLAAIIRPIVEGQVRAWMDAHPDGERYPGHMVTGIGKRITHDICADQTVRRIELALRGPGSAATPGDQSAGGLAPPAGDVGDGDSHRRRQADQPGVRAGEGTASARRLPGMNER